MTDALKQVPDGGFAYLPDTGRAFSRAVVALDGCIFRRTSFQQALPMEDGLDLAATMIRSAGRPLAAFCGCELRTPRRLTRTEFSSLNRRFVAALQSSGFDTDPVNPAARTNMAPADDAPDDAVLTAFTFSLPGAWRAAGADFLVSGKPELNQDRVIAPNDTSPAGMQMKAAFVVQELQRTVRQLGAPWRNITAAQIYTRHPLADLEDVFASSGLPSSLCTHVPGDPPVFGPGDIPLEFESDVRSITLEETA